MVVPLRDSQHLQCIHTSFRESLDRAWVKAVEECQLAISLLPPYEDSGISVE